MFYAFKIGIREKIELLSCEADTKDKLLTKVKEEDSTWYDELEQNAEFIIEADNVDDAKEIYGKVLAAFYRNRRQDEIYGGSIR